MKKQIDTDVLTQPAERFAHWRRDFFDAPPATQAWLRWQGSVTVALERVFGAPPLVEVVRVAVTPGSVLACRALGLRDGRLVLERDVRIFAGGRARVSARTVAAYRERSAALALLQGLGGRSLGHALFAPRGRLTAHRVDARYAPPDAAGLPAVAGLPGAWARCTRWRVRHDLLAVTEVFHVTQPDEAPQPPR